MNQIEKYVKENLLLELSVIESTFRKMELQEISNVEKAIVYKYSEDGFESVNELLRDSEGIKNSTFGKLLVKCLKKLPNYKKLCFRAVQLNSLEIEKYKDALENNKIITEYSFVSCSTSRLIAMQFKHNVLFRIYSKKGKNIQNIAKFGIRSGQNEKEILFTANSEFYVLDVKSENNKTLITLEEF